MIKVSIIIPVYNGAMYLRDCLDSILQQILDGIEIICVDDASTDSTLSILQEYQKNNSNIKIIINLTNKGAGISRNKGLDIAKGKYIIFLDADDIFEPDMLYRALCRAEEYYADICVFREDMFTEHITECMEYAYPSAYWEYLEKKGVFSPEDVQDVIFNIWNGWPWDKLFRRSFLLKNKIRFQEIKSSEDGLFVHGALAVAEKITCINQIYVHHRVNVNTSLSNNRDDSWNCCCLYLKELKKYLIEHNKYASYEKSFINWAADFLYWNYCTLKEENRKKLFWMIKEDMLKKLSFLTYDSSFFYNSFYYWYLHTIDESARYGSCVIPIEATQKWMTMLICNTDKIKKLFRYLNDYQYRAAIWGAGKRAEFFLGKYKDKSLITKVYDIDDKRAGKVLFEEYIITPFDSLTSQEVDFIIVLNTIYFSDIVSRVKKEKSEIFVFDLELYITSFRAFPITLVECIL